MHFRTSEWSQCLDSPFNVYTGASTRHPPQHHKRSPPQRHVLAIPYSGTVVAIILQTAAKTALSLAVGPGRVLRTHSCHSSVLRSLRHQTPGGHSPLRHFRFRSLNHHPDKTNDLGNPLQQRCGMAVGHTSLHQLSGSKATPVFLLVRIPQKK